MDKLGKNKFLTAMGVLFVIAIAAWAVLVMPAGGTANAHTSKIRSVLTGANKDLGDLPGDPNVKVSSDQADALKRRYEAQLRKQLEKDQGLGQWFEGIDDSSTFATFMAPYDDMRIKLEDELVGKGVDLGSPVDVDKDGKLTETRQPGFNWIQRLDVTRADTHDKEMLAKEILQKRFNICRAVVNAVTADVEKSQGRKRRLLDVTFLEKFPFLPVAAGGVSTTEGKVFTIPVDPKRYVGYTGPGSASFSELMLPQNGDKPVADDGEGKTSDAPAAPARTEPYLGKTMSFGFAVVMDYHQLPVLVRNLIDPPSGAELNLNIVGLSVFVPEPNPPVKVEVVNIPAGGDKEEHLKRAKQQTENCLPPQVHVYFTCQVFDVDPAAVPPYLKLKE